MKNVIFVHGIGASVPKEETTRALSQNLPDAEYELGVLKK